ncbi:hypothetical protein [Corynebacterium glyciniphilum]|uniref:hypothetical protein n=1 Tax=Corynebacterium glyciniphilum TaxID=1404244 RepID=UPI0011AB6F2E|nr:hypothetical protein [Corynebacterium glyciniphilum]
MVSPEYDWLPDRHLGVAATLSHADELIGQVCDLLSGYHTQPDGIIRLREVPIGDISRTTVTGIAPIPRKVPLLVADALVALRAALEHTLFTEVEHLHSARLEEKAARLIEIPAADTYESFQEWLKKRARNGPASLRAGDVLTKRIEGLQPYQRTVNPHEHPLARLVLHTNHAKHRTPTITAVRLAAMYPDDQAPRTVQEIPRRPEQPLRINDVIAETPIGAQHAFTLFPTVGINRPGSDRWPVLVKELDEIARWVRTQAVPRLITGTEPPKPHLPARYEMDVGHDDERAAVAAGSTVTAAEHHLERLNASIAREGLYDILGHLDGAPTSEQISAWLKQLSDNQVLKQMAKIKPPSNYDPDIIMSNYTALLGMRDEVRAFEDGLQSTTNLT